MSGRKSVTPNEAHGLHELKKKAQCYYQENGVPQKIEEVLNSMFYDDPKDVYGHLVSVLFILYLSSHTVTHLHRLHVHFKVT